MHSCNLYEPYTSVLICPLISKYLLTCFCFRNNGNASPDGNGSPNESDRKRLRRPFHSKTYKVEISYAAKIPMQAIASALRGQESENSQGALRVLDIILRQHASKQWVKFCSFLFPIISQSCMCVLTSFFLFMFSLAGSLIKFLMLKELLQGMPPCSPIFLS